MDAVQHSFDHFGLHRAATAGDDDGVSRAISLGADINGLDTAGRTAIMCAVAGEHWQDVDASDASFMTPKRLNTIRTILRHPDISLFTLNAPQSPMNGVIPLGMAAWLNKPDAVQLLLEESADTVSVDGMDTHGATALMYAARDGGLEVVQLLLSHGARPDFRDCNHRTSIQYALSHPQILWLCESVLRRHRWRESQSADRNKLSPGFEDLLELTSSSLPSDSLEAPPPSIFTNQATSRLTDTLISSIASSDLSFLHSLLFAPALPPSSPSALYPMSAPVLVNRLDSDGWGPIHHCVSVKHPCIQVLDALYCAGAEVALFTTNEHYTPLHILAQSARLFVENSDDALSLYHFTVHLIHDLRAPLSARDQNDETCIHIAAEHGNCINLLMIFLDCDITGTVRELRNSRGLTALEVAKPEFRAAFGEDAEKLRSVSSLSTRTIRQTDSFTSLVSFSELKPTVLDDTLSLYSPLDFDIEGSTQQLLFKLRTTSPSINHRTDPDYVDHLDNLLESASQLNLGIINHFRSRVEEASRELQDLRTNSDKIGVLLDLVTQTAVDKIGARGFMHLKRNRDSEDSQYTAVSGIASRNISTSHIRQLDDQSVSVGTQTSERDAKSSPPPSPSQVTTWIYWGEGSPAATDASTYKAHLGHLTDVDRELSYLERNTTGSPTMEARIRYLAKKKRKLEEKIRQLDGEKKAEKKDVASHGTAKIKSWIKRILTTYDKPTKLEIIKDIDEQGCAVGREVKSWTISSIHYLNTFDIHIDDALRTSNVVLNASRRDLLTIQQCLSSADQFINLANHSISRAERVIKRAFKKRETMISNLRFATSSANLSDDASSIRQDIMGTPGALGFGLLSSRPSVASLSSVYSSHSSVASVAPTLIENDDEDTRAIRRLLLRKIEASIVGSWDEMDKVMGWLRIVKEVVRGVKRRAYL